jgi:hypothetical protein
MKRILLLTGVLALLINSGCIVAESHGHGHWSHHSHSEVIVRSPAVIVQPPPVIVVPAVRVHVD